MTDVEQRLRDQLHDEVRRIPIPSPVGAPDHVRRGIRVRQATVVASVAVLVTAAAAAILVAREALDPTPSVRPAESPSETRAEGDRVLVAQGNFEGTEWEYFVYQEGRDWCDWIESSHSGGGGCGPAGTEQGRWSIGISSGSADEPALVNGWVPDEASRVVVELESGESIEADIHTPPPESGAPHRVFIAWIDARNFKGVAKALDENGQVLAHQRIGETSMGAPPPFPPPNLEVIASGTSFGLDWDTFILEEGAKWCSGVDLGDQGAGYSCPRGIETFEVSGDLPRSFEATPKDPGDASTSEDPIFVWGVLRDDVAEIRYELDDGRVFDADIFETPAPVPWNVFLIVFRGGDFYVGPEKASGFVVGLDEGGRELDRIAWPPSRSV